MILSRLGFVKVWPNIKKRDKSVDKEARGGKISDVMNVGFLQNHLLSYARAELWDGGGKKGVRGGCGTFASGPGVDGGAGGSYGIAEGSYVFGRGSYVFGGGSYVFGRGSYQGKMEKRGCRRGDLSSKKRTRHLEDGGC